MFGIDFTSIGSIKLKYIEDINVLLNSPNVTIRNGDGAISTITDLKGQDLIYSTIIIEDNKEFKQLTIGSKLEKEFKKDYIIIDLSIKGGTGHNLKPLSKEEYDNKLNDLTKYIEKKYKIALSFENANFRLLEINNTVLLENDVNEYYYVLKAIADFAPKRYKNNNIARDGDKKLKGIFLGNDTMEYKIYNKTKQLEEVYNIVIKENYIRFEIALLNSKKIKEVFGTTKIKDITMEMIEDYYIKTIQKDLFKSVDKYIKDSTRELKKIAKVEKEKDVRKWVKNFFLSALSLKYKVKDEITDIDLVYDMQQLLDIIKKETGKNYSRAYKNLKDYIEERPHKKENLAKYDEIKNKILHIE